MLRNSPAAWGWVSRTLHWGMAILLIAQVALGKYAHELGRTPQKMDLMMWHKSIGITLLLLVILRLLWTVSNTRPLPDTTAPMWERAAARLSHVGLYLLMLAIPLSGWLMNSAKNVPFSLFRLIPWPALVAPNESLGESLEEWHEGLATVILVLLLVHAAAALWHHFVKKDKVLLRMLGMAKE